MNNASFATDQTSRDFSRIARAVEFLQREAPRQPDLSTVARHVNVSEFHLQRLFTHWAGVSPKRFLQYLTVEHAKGRLADSRSVVDVADRVGLSGPGRLHDLFVTIEAMSPGEFRAAGAGITLSYGVHPSPFGACLIATTARGICTIHFMQDGEDATRFIRDAWPRARCIWDPVATGAIAATLFEPLALRHAPLALLVKGTNFQLQVWRALLAVPPGRLTSYSEIARRIGRPHSQRAVGNAVAANPIAWLIPCHRVIRETGRFGDYRWGVARKAAMLGWEAARDEAAGVSRTLASTAP